MTGAPGRHHDQPAPVSTETEDRVIPVVHARLKARYGEHQLVELRHNSKNLGSARGMNQALEELLACGEGGGYEDAELG